MNASTHLPRFATTAVLAALFAGGLAGGLAGSAVGQTPAAPAAEGSQERSGQIQGANRYRLAPWLPDYPIELQLPTPAPQQVYERSRRQALEKVVANLQGNVSRDAWHMAMEFFSRAPEDAIEPLTEAMDRAFGQPAMHDFVKHCIEAMGQVGSTECDDALQRALEHPSDVVRQAVYSALVGSGSTETIRKTYRLFFSGMDGRGRKNWLRAARLRLGDEAVPMFRQLMEPSTPLAVRDLIVVEAMEMGYENAAKILEGLWPHAKDSFKVLIAGVFHAADITSGTVHLQTLLRGTDNQMIVHALNNLEHRGPLALYDDVLKLSESPDPQVRLQVANLLSKLEDEQSTAALERLTAPDQPIEIQMVALRALTKRGSTDQVDYLLDEVDTSTGSRLSVHLRMLGASGDPRCVAIFRERLRTCPPEEGREFLQALAFCGAPGAEEAMVDLFLGEERAIAGANRAGGALTTVNYIPVLLPNLRGNEQVLVDAWDRIPAEDHRRRALYLQSLLSIAADREDQSVREPIVNLLRRLVYDREALPQLRIQALNALTRKFLTLNDAMRLKRLQQPVGDRETPNMRAFVKDFLFEYF